MKQLPWNQARSQRLQAALDEQLLAILHRRLAAMGIQAGKNSSSSSSSSSSGGSGSNAGACPFHSAAGSAAGPAGSSAAADGEEALEGGMSSSSGARDILSLAVEASARDGEVDEQMLLSQARPMLGRAGHASYVTLPQALQLPIRVDSSCAAAVCWGIFAG